MKKNTHWMYTTILAVATLSLGACTSTFDRLDNIGSPPPLTAVQDPTAQPGYAPISWPLPENAPPERQYSNTLWQPGARAFFRDQRASRVGDVLRVKIAIDNRAEVKNDNDVTRDSTEVVAAPKLFGLEGKLKYLTPGTPDRDALFDVTGSTNHAGTGEIKREERIETDVAALITQVLPNGNYVIDGTQEIRINDEVREVSVKGVVRPQDIDSDNTIDSSQVAQARIVYGGRGMISDTSRPRWGNQVIDILSPF